VGFRNAGAKAGAPCSPANAGAFRLACGLAAQPAQDMGRLDVLGTLDVSKAVTDACLELRFK